MNVDTELKSERSLSCFFARELFSLYLEGQLDLNRVNQIKTHLSRCASCSLLLEKLTLSREIITELSKTKPTSALIEYVRKEQHFWTEYFDQVGWKNWPSTLKWAAELSLVATLLVGTIHYFPWLNLARRLHKIQKSARVEPLTAMGPEPQSTDSIEHNVQLRNESPPVTVPGASDVAIKAVDKRIPLGPLIPDEIRKQREKATSVAISPPFGQNESDQQADQTVAANDTEISDPGSTVPKMAGFVWKGNLKVEKISDEVTARVTQAISDLGGVKAGQVELGWHRGDQRYYHFILPEENYDKLLSSLNAEGIVTLTKEPHPRVIKTGHLRIIMTVEEAE